MDTAQMVAKMRQLETALPPELNRLIQLQRRETHPDGTVTNYYQIPNGSKAPGYLWIHYEPQEKTLLAAEMDVDFPCLVGLNRSPIQLRLTAAHILEYLP